MNNINYSYFTLSNITGKYENKLNQCDFINKLYEELSYPGTIYYSYPSYKKDELKKFIEKHKICHEYSYGLHRRPTKSSKVVCCLPFINKPNRKKIKESLLIIK